MRNGTLRTNEGLQSGTDDSSESRTDGQSIERRSRKRNRGQSELVGFLLIFSAAIVIVALAAVAGFVGVDAAQDFQKTNNAEQAFSALDNDIDDIVHHGAPSRATEIGLTDAQLSVEETESITIEWNEGESVSAETSPIVYDADGTTITYHSGAVIRQDGEHPVLLRKPDFVIENETLLLPIIRTIPEQAGAVGGRTDVTLESRHDGSAVLVSNESVDEVSVTVTTEQADAWAEYFEQLQENDGVETVEKIHETDESIAYEIEMSETAQLHVIETRVTVSFQ